MTGANVLAKIACIENRAGRPAGIPAGRLGFVRKNAGGAVRCGKDGIVEMEAERHQELCRVLTDHARRYPLMQPCDVVKLIFQNEFGGEHLLCEPNATLAWLRAERAATADDPAVSPLEDIGNGIVRVALAALERSDAALEALNRDFIRSAQLQTGRRKTFLEKLDVLRQLAEEGLFSFTRQELEKYLEEYIRSGCCPVSHSPAYSEAYRPAYRVVRRANSLVVLTWELEQLRCRGERSVIAIDGRCASGKSTLAARLSQRLGLPVVHMDDFFLRPEQRSRARLAKPGENIDHERFLEEVLRPLSVGERPVYHPFDCHTGQLGEPVTLEASPVVLVEGSYACHPALWDYYKRRVFLTVEPDRQLQRIEARDGAEGLEAFRERWIPLEERYFSAFRIEERCDYQLEF